MATTDDSAQDALLLLRTSIAANSQPIPTSNPDASSASDVSSSLAQATHLLFNSVTSSAVADGTQHVAVLLGQPTRFVSGNTGRPIDLRSVYLCWLNKDKSVQEYISATTALNEELAQAGKQETVTNLVFNERLDLNNWLSGDVAEQGESEFIRAVEDNRGTRAEVNDAAATAAGGEDVEMRDAGLSDAAARKREEERLREIYALERKMGDRNTVLHGVKVQDFSGVKKFSAVFLSKSRPQQPQQQQPNAPAAPLTTNPSLRPAIKPSSSNHRRAEQPIILLSPSASSLIRMPNAKNFLQDGVYAAPDAGASAPNILHLQRLLPSIDASKPLRFILVDSPEQFRPDYWNRVVAVFTTGQAWQFKGYKWQQPADLWTHVVGVYVGWKGEVVPDTVRGWGRGVVKVSLDKGPNARWRDREVVEEVWSGIESKMRSLGWTKDGPRQ